MENSIPLFDRTGVSQANNVTIQIPYREEVTGLKYLEPNEWLKLSEEDVMSNRYWSVSPRLYNFQTFPQVLRGRSTHKFEWANSGNIVTQETNFANANPDVRKVRDINIFFNAYADTRQNVEFTSDMRFMLLRAQLS